MANTKITQAQGDARYSKKAQSKGRIGNFRVSADASSVVDMPNGWLPSEVSSGTIDITHNLGYEIFPVIQVIAPNDVPIPLVTIISSGTSSFRYFLGYPTVPIPCKVNVFVTY